MPNEPFGTLYVQTCTTPVGAANNARTARLHARRPHIWRSFLHVLRVLRMELKLLMEDAEVRASAGPPIRLQRAREGTRSPIDIDCDAPILEA